VARPARPDSATQAGALVPGQQGRTAIGLAATGLSVLLTLGVGVLGPSLLEPALPGRAGQPPWSFSVHPSPYLVVALALAAVVTGTAGLAMTMRAARLGWAVRPWLLLAAGIAAAGVLALVPPFGSADHLSYAAYGRMAATGHDPYTMTPAALARLGDPVGRVVRQFQSSPSVYGALATAGQALASRVGGTSVRLTVFVLSVLNVAAFALTGLLLHWLSRRDRGQQLRAAVLWTANPLLLMVLVAGQHVDSQAVVFVIAALAAFSFCTLAGPGWERTVLPAAAAGALVGLGFAVKVTMALAGAGLATACLLAWRLRGQAEPATAERARLVAAAGGLAAGFAVTAGASLAAYGVSSLDPGLMAGSYTSFGSPWRVVRAALGLGLTSAAAETTVKAGALVLGLILLVLLLRSARSGLPGAGPAGRAPLLAPPRGQLATRVLPDHPVPLFDLAVLCAAAFAIAWLFSWPYVLPWYDAIGWALLALVAWSQLDWLLLARTAALALGYLTATGAPLPDGLGWLETVVRKGVTPAVLLICTVLLIRAVLPARQARAMRS
jgi:hypothetical protein